MTTVAELNLSQAELAAAKARAASAREKLIGQYWESMVKRSAKGADLAVALQTKLGLSDIDIENDRRWIEQLHELAELAGTFGDLKAECIEIRKGISEARGRLALPTTDVVLHTYPEVQAASRLLVNAKTAATFRRQRIMYLVGLEDRPMPEDVKAALWKIADPMKMNCSC